MRFAVVDIVGDMLPRAAQVMKDHGLQFAGTFNSRLDEAEDVLRLVIKDQFGNLLPDECANGWWKVAIDFSIDSYGEQCLTRITSIRAVGRLEFAPNGDAMVMPA